ncbi:MAG: hypothetical protein KBH81_08090, partial [Phycisphaerae bacterium]|nr:hypothetical protein [Phycisphaerae bacterium]
RTVGFITNTFKDSLTGEELCSVFIATTPNPTTGFVFVLRRSDLIEVDWSVEEAIKMAVSAGILSPPNITMMTGPKLAALSSARPAAAKPLSEARANTASSRKVRLD